MANAHPTVAEREKSLRRIAVVLSSLPAPTAANLLSTLTPQVRHMIHQTVATLTPVETDERTKILESFRDRIHGDVTARIMATTKQSAGSVQDEIVIGEQSTTFDQPDQNTRFYEQLAAELDTPATDDTADEAASLDFLSSVPNETLVNVLNGEHPQTVALVMASISPKKAAELLPNLKTDAASETLHRIGQLDDIPDESIAEIAAHLQTRIEAQTHPSASSGKRALHAIMAEMPELAARKTHAEPTAVIPLTKKSTASSSQTAKIEQTTSEQEPATSSPLHAATVVELESQSDLRIFDPSGQPSQSRSSQIQTVTSAGTAKTKSSWPSTFLEQLPTHELVLALGKASRREALLTLCGLPQETAERAISKLSRGKSRQVREGMTGLGDMQLREIDQAMSRVASFAISARESSVRAA